MAASKLAEELRPQLEERLKTLTRREEALQKHLRGQDGRLEADSQDKVSFNEQDEVLEGLDDEARKEITKIRTALSRIDNGAYGVCIDCGEDIPEKRLKAVPATSYCVSCAAAH